KSSIKTNSASFCDSLFGLNIPFTILELLPILYQINAVNWESKKKKIKDCREFLDSLNEIK
ncbi:hypothetical protein, partial [Metabacillus lacus]|uniref:hypothetical protein n=1 Tax=Metabacillus lacus TaxID=1983721 RepID=UPI001BA940FB